MGTLYNFEKEVKAISHELATSLNTIIRGHVDKKMLPHKLENIKSDFLYACVFFAYAHRDTVSMLNKHSSTYRTQEIIYYLGYAYFRIVALFQKYDSIVEKYTETKDRKALLDDLRYIRQQIRSVYL